MSKLGVAAWAIAGMGAMTIAEATVVLAIRKRRIAPRSYLALVNFRLSWRPAPVRNGRTHANENGSLSIDVRAS